VVVTIRAGIGTAPRSRCSSTIIRWWAWERMRTCSKAPERRARKAGEAGRYAGREVARQENGAEKKLVDAAAPGGRGGAEIRRENRGPRVFFASIIKSLASLARCRRALFKMEDGARVPRLPGIPKRRACRS